jgi:kynureninase
VYHFDTSLQCAQQLDAQDVLAPYRQQFIFPQHDGRNVLYFCGNSLGLQPKTVREYINRELDNWGQYGVEGHFNGEMPWKKYHHFFKEPMARLVGALPTEVSIMNTLTTNLHLMMVSFYRPQGKRYKIMMEGGAFPSDQYAVESQVKFHGYAYDDACIELVPREGEDYLRQEDILQAIQEHGDSLALVMFGGVNYYTGQFFDLAAITQAAHAVGAVAGFDLAHTAGNVPLQLHDWGADFAVWCTYKYLNSGPGGPSGVFVHERHANNPDLPRFAGWWGHDEASRFQMKKGFIPMSGADGWQLSNAQVLSMAAHKASLDMFDAVGMEAIRAKSLQLTAYLDYMLRALIAEKGWNYRIITPSDPQQRGAQISMLTDENGKAMFDKLMANGIIPDWREPNVIRFAPVPMYNSYEDVWQTVQLMR